MRAGLAAMTALILVSPAHAACRLHTIWHYPWAQRCRVEASVPPDKSWFVDIAATPPLPDLADIDWGKPAQLDPETLGRLMLRAKMEAR